MSDKPMPPPPLDSENKQRRPRAPVVQTHSDDYDNDDVVETLDARKWVERLKQSQKLKSKPAPPPPPRRRRKEYSAAELAGVRVSHDISELTSGDAEHVLTLQDKSIDELDTDCAVELHSAALAGTKRTSDDNNNTTGGGSDPPVVTSSLTIREGGVINDETAEEQKEQLRRRGQTAISLQDDEAPARNHRTTGSDFYTEEEAAALFRKPKKHKSSGIDHKAKQQQRKSRNTKTQTTNDFEPLADVAAYSRHARIDDSRLADDDEDLQRAIAAVRRSAAHARPALPTAEDIARQVHDDAMARMDTAGPDAAAEENSELALSSTIEFVQSLKAASASAAAQKPSAMEEEEEEEEKEDERETVIVKRAVAAPEPPAEPLAKPITANAKEIEVEKEAATTKEPSVGSGLYATLNLLRQRNMLDKLTDDQRQREKQQRSRDALLAEQRRQGAALALERQRIKQLGAHSQKQKPTATAAAAAAAPSLDKKRRGKADELTAKELDEIKAREQEALDRKWAREYEERMRDYKPQVTLEYVDETGRQLTTKEAYKQLSHAFHGHYSGKNKIDKVMAKRENERKQLEITSGASTHHYGAVLENAHKKLGSAGIVLASGNKPGLGPSSSSSSSAATKRPNI